MAATTLIPLAALQAAAAALAASVPSSIWPIGPQLEAWVTLVLGGALKAHADVTLGPPGSSVFYVRLNQHKTLKGPLSSWLDISAPSGHFYELHNALQICGWSGAHHEVDVCIVKNAHFIAPVCAQQFIAGIECKQHQASVQENVARTLLGVRVDIEAGPYHPVGWSQRPWAVVSTSTKLSANTRTLLNGYHIDFIGVDAGSASHTHPGITEFARKLAWLI